MNPIQQTPKVFASVELLSTYPANTQDTQKKVDVYFTDGTCQQINYSAISNQVNALTAQLALATAIQTGIATALNITQS